MKTWMLLAVVALAPMVVYAEPAPVNESTRADLVKEIEAARTALLPQTEPLPQVTVLFQPRLNVLKAAAASAKAPAEMLKARKDFGDWKVLVLRHLYGENRSMTGGGETLPEFSARRMKEADFIMGMRQQLAAQRTEAEVRSALATSRRDSTFSSLFDNSAPRASVADGAVRAEAPRAANDPARYDKIRSLLLSQGVSPKIIDTAISEGVRQKVDPMIVLSVINQESNFRKNAYNRGSGCTGLMQLDPATAADMGVRGSLYDSGVNIKAGVKYLNWIANSFFKMNLDMSDLSKVPAEKLKMVLASYNWGIGNVQRLVNKYGTEALDRVAPKETRNYIAQIPSRISAWFASF
jgi:soluble lytic murein transglycosylase-like protein